MFPASSATAIAATLALGGLLACFAGYRLFRFVLGLYGFYFGAMMATQMMAPSNTWGLIVAGLAGGVVGAVLMVAAYFLGVGLVGAFLAALAVNGIWHFIGGDPPTVLLVIACVIGALGALSVVRYVVVLGTALAGSWTLLIGALALAGNGAAMKAASAGDVWILYPLDPQPAGWWMLPAWLGLAIVGAIVQLSTTKASGAKKSRK
jgi:hypothetical protein